MLGSKNQEVNITGLVFTLKVDYIIQILFYSLLFSLSSVSQKAHFISAPRDTFYFFSQMFSALGDIIVCLAVLCIDIRSFIVFCNLKQQFWCFFEGINETNFITNICNIRKVSFNHQIYFTISYSISFMVLPLC